jgi:hypothetical protein
MNLLLVIITIINPDVNPEIIENSGGQPGLHHK